MTTINDGAALQLRQAFRSDRRERKRGAQQTASITQTARTSGSFVGLCCRYSASISDRAPLGRADEALHVFPNPQNTKQRIV